MRRLLCLALSLAACGGDAFTVGDGASSTDSTSAGAMVTSAGGAVSSGETVSASASSTTGSGGLIKGCWPTPCSSTAITTGAESATTGQGGAAETSSSTGSASSCPNIPSCAGEPECAAALGTEIGECKIGSYACGAHQGWFSEDGMDFPCELVDGVSDCTDASKAVSDYSAQCSQGTSSGGAASTTSTTGDTEPVECGCGEPGTADAPHLYACVDLACIECPPGYIDCDGDYPEESFGCEMPVVESRRRSLDICDSINEWRALCCDGKNHVGACEIPSWSPNPDNPCWYSD